MSFFSGIEVSKEYSGANAFEVLAEGQYKAMIEEIGLAEYDKIGSYVNAKWIILEGAAENRTVYQKIKCFEDVAARVKGTEDAVVERSKKMLLAIDANCGGKLLASGKEPGDSVLMLALANKPMMINLQIWEMGDKKGNWVSGVAPAVHKAQVAETAAYEEDIAF